MSKEQKKSRIPEFKSIEEEAEFWDTHDITDFLDELEPAEFELSPELRRKLEERSREWLERRRRAVS